MVLANRLFLKDNIKKKTISTMFQFSFFSFTQVLPNIEVQATVTPRFTTHLTVTPLRIASFFHETSAFTRLG